jgi:hypothetical protein
MGERTPRPPHDWRPDGAGANHVLVAYASRYGSTEGVADRIAAGVRARGFRVDLLSVGEIHDTGSYDADRHQRPFFSRLFFHAFGGRFGDNRDWTASDAWAESIALALRTGDTATPTA